MSDIDVKSIALFICRGNYLKHYIKKSPAKAEDLMAGQTRLELATSCVTGMHSNQLSYWPLL